MPILFEHRKKHPPAKTEPIIVIPIVFSTSCRIISVLLSAADSEISGMSRVEIACKKEDGKNIIGKAIPLSRPKVSRPLLLLPENAERHFGTSRFSAVCSPLVKYLPAVIGVAILSIAEVTLPLMQPSPSEVVSFFLSALQQKKIKIQLTVSAMVSASST